MAKTNHKKKMKKMGRSRMRRAVMGTLSAILMISAIIVALVPIPESRADSDPTDLIAAATANPDTYIPAYTNTGNYPVYASGDGNFRAAYGSNGGSMTGVIVYYDQNNVITGATLEIPDEMPAFLYNKDTSSYIAVNDRREFLFYTSQEAADAVYDENGALVSPAQNQILSPCTYDTQGAWQGMQLYVVPGAALGNVELVSGNSVAYAASNQLIIPVQYVGSTRYEVDLNNVTSDGVDGQYVSDGVGVFEGATNFSRLVVPERILAIGNNAFKGCQMQSIKIENGVNSIGNNAFQNCNQLTTIDFTEPTNLKEIGDYAFAGCTYLGAVKVPDQVTKLGNYCFKDCTNLTAININGVSEDGNTSLTTIGNGLFYNCISLSQVIFPERVSNIDSVHYTCYGCSSMTYLGMPNNAGSTDQIFKYDNVTGCNSLDTVKVPARDLKLDCGCAANTGSGYDNIYTGGKDIFSSENLGKNSAFEGDYEVSDQFCILAYSQSYAHSYTQKHDLAFGYLDSGYEGWYEKLVDGYAFCVNENNELIRFEKKDESSDGANVIIPDNIAKYHVARIAADTFQNNTAIKFLYIPASVSSIDANAFSGCTSLRTVKFDNAASVQQIGQDAFKTGVTLADVDKNGDGVPEENLCFIGDISSASVPFTYAMSTANNYNAPSAPTQYIRYCSDFPQNLQIQLVVKKNANTNEVDSATPMLAGIPTENQLKGNESYSLSTYTGSSKYVRTQQQENDIVASANSKYRNNLNNPDTAIDLTEEEQGVIDAVYHVHVPDGVTALKEDLFQNNTAVQSVILDTVAEIPDQEFDGCTSLKTFIMKESGAEGGEVIGKRAFNNCTALTEVTLPGTVSTFTEVPFAGCKELTDVGFTSPGGYACADGLLCSVDGSGNRTGVVECLESRGTKIGASKISSSELAGITDIAPCAFQNCTGIREAYLDEVSTTLIPDYCFDGATQLYYCSLSDSVKRIGKYAFRNTALSTIRIPGSVQAIDDEAFITDDGAGNVNYIQGLTVQCEEDSPAYWYCDDKDGITAETYSKTYTVTFLDWDNYVLKTQTVNSGASADAPRVERKGYVLTGWTKDFTNVREDITTQAIYEPDNSAPIEGYYSVVFQDYDGLYTWDTQYLQEGSYPTTPSVTPTRKGYKFSYWSPSNYTTIAVTGDMIVKAYYVEDPNATDDNNNNGNNGNNGNNNNGNNGNNSGGNGTTGTNYTVTFVDYDGSVLDTQVIASGSCPAATTVTPTRKGYTFTTWSPSNYTSVPVTGNLTVTALYKKGTASTGESGTGDISSDTTKGNTNNGNTNNNGGGNKGNNTGAATASPKPTATAKKGAAAVANKKGSVSSNTVNRKPATTAGSTRVEVTKSGISNRGLVSATVSGSNDNFVIKISDSDEAKDAVEKALLASYGSLDDLKYFAMDISLYDSTGTTKIADTTGITVTVTMPIPDALAGYAGNNKAGAVNNGVFEKLGSRLLTIDNVPCISFNATHFSPYAIYVETNNLTQAQISDATPKTGDPIHPKWFLAMGLALLSILLFFAKGSKNKVVKVIE